jgi:CHAD domain-containing protein
MTVEREVKLLAADDFVVPSLDGDGMRLVDGGTERLEARYYDTPDLRLLRWGVTLRHRTDEGWTVKLPADGGARSLARHELRFPGSASAPPNEAADLVRAFVRGSRLRQVARVRTDRHRLVLTDADGSALAEIADDRVAVTPRGRAPVRFREVEVEEKASREATRLVARVTRALVKAGATPADPQPKLARAFGEDAGTPEIEGDHLPASPSVGDVLRLALARSVIRLLVHDAGVRVGDDPEELHQARVATRRLRSDLRTFRSVLDEAWTSSLRDQLRWLGGLLGAVRDADVLADGLHTSAASIGPGAADNLLRRLATRRKAARRTLLDAMRTPRYATLLERLVAAAIGELPLLPAANAPAEGVLPSLVAAPWGHARTAARAMADEPGDAELHQLRIRTKRARYAAEAAVPVLGRKAERFAKSAAKFQDLLGEHQDAVVAQAWLHRTAVRSAPADAFIAGRLAEMDRAAAAAVREAWPVVWKEVRRRWPSGWS